MVYKLFPVSREELQGGLPTVLNAYRIVCDGFVKIVDQKSDWKIDRKLSENSGKASGTVFAQLYPAFLTGIGLFSARFFGRKSLYIFINPY